MTTVKLRSTAETLSSLPRTEAKAPRATPTGSPPSPHAESSFGLGGTARPLPVANQSASPREVWANAHAAAEALLSTTSEAPVIAPSTVAVACVMLQQQYNGNARKTDWTKHPTGQARIFHVPIETQEVQLIGDFANSVFRAPDGGIRLAVHPEALTLHDYFAERFGAAQQMPASPTSSGRTFLVHGDSAHIKGPAPENDGHKRITPHDAELSINWTRFLANTPYIVPETSAACVPRLQVAFIERAIPTRPDGTLREGDFHAPWHVFTDPAFQTSVLGRALFARHGGYDNWMATQVQPKLNALLVDSFFESFCHFELHAQNVELVVDRTGTVHALKVKDMLDNILDLAAFAAAKHTLPDAQVLEGLRKASLSHVAGVALEVPGEPNAQQVGQSIDEIYFRYFIQIGSQVLSGYRNASNTMRRTAVSAVIAEARERLAAMGFDEAQLQTDFSKADLDCLNPCWERPDAPDDSFAEFRALNDVRNLMIRAQLTHALRTGALRKDDAAEAQFKKRLVVSVHSDTAQAYLNRRNGGENALFAHTQHGFLRDIPVAFNVGPTGAVSCFWFPFAAQPKAGRRAKAYLRGFVAD